MTDDEDRTRVVSPNTIPRPKLVIADDDDRTAVMKDTERAQVLEAVALARAPLDFDLTGADNNPAPTSQRSVDFDLTGGDDSAAPGVGAALDLDLGSGETSIPAVAAAVVGAAANPAPLKPRPQRVEPPAPSAGIGKWIVIALAIVAAVVASLILRK